MDFYQFIDNPEVSNTLLNPEKALLLILLRDSLISTPANFIAWISTPKEACLTLQQQFSYSLGLQRDSLYREFYTLNFSSNNRSLAKLTLDLVGLSLG